MTSVARWLVAAALSAAALPAPAAAATADAEIPGVPSLPEPVLSISASPGEHNAVTVSKGAAAREIVVRDSGAPLKASGECTLRSDGSADCFATPSEYTRSGITTVVQLGDEDDTVRIESRLPGEAILEGGDGNDRLTGGDEDDLIIGGPGDDVLAGAGGRDTFAQAPSDPLLSFSGQSGFDAPSAIAPSRSADAIDGGRGVDLVTYEGDAAPIVAQLAAGTVTGGGHADHLRDVEGVEGGSGDDRLTGSSRADVLIGGAGADSLAGGAGGDVLVGADGADRLDGGIGDDIVDGSKPADARISCGAGHDVQELLAGARVETGCEQVSGFFGGKDDVGGLTADRLVDARPIGIGVRARRRGRSLIFDVHCPPGLSCSAHVYLEDLRGRPLGHSAITHIRNGRRANVVVRLTKAARRSQVKVDARLFDDDANLFDTRYVAEIAG